MKFLFDVYKKNHGPRFGSRFMNCLGRLFMGSPEGKGLDGVRQDLRDTYYWDKKDRVIPVDALDEWMEQSILVNEYRQVEAPAAAWATTIVLAVSTTLLVLAGSRIANAREAGEVVGDLNPATCEAFQAAVYRGEELPAQQAKFQRRIANACKDKLRDSAKSLVASMDDNACMAFVVARDTATLPNRHAAHGDALTKHCRSAEQARGLELVEEMNAENCAELLPLFDADEAPAHLVPYQDQLVKACKPILKQ